MEGYGLPLSDQYWFCNSENLENWEEVNFFDNDLPEDYFRSPDIAAAGAVPKTWEKMIQFMESLSDCRSMAEEYRDDLNDSEKGLDAVLTAFHKHAEAILLL